MPDPFVDPLNIGAVGFTGSPLDRADHLRRDEAGLDSLRCGLTARFLVFTSLRVHFKTADEGLTWFDGSAIPPDALNVFLGLHEGIPHFAANVNLPGEPVEVRAAAARLPDSSAAILAQARSLLAWHDRHRRCSVCGSPTRSIKGGYERVCESQQCGAEHFPRTDPVVIMLVIDGDRCLLGRHARLASGFYSTLAGFVEPGETIEEAVAREVREESGIRVGRVRYVASQPWPFPSSLMIGCFAEALTTGITIDPAELQDAKWFTRAEALSALAGNGPFQCSPSFAISHTLLKTWAEL